MGAIAAITAVSAGSSLLTANAQAKATKAQGNFQATQLEGNAQLSDIQAADAIKRGSEEVSRLRIKTRLDGGDLRAGLAAQGQDLSGETEQALQQDIVGFAEEDAQTTKNNAWRESFGYRAQAVEQRSQAGFTRLTAGTTAKQALLTGGMTALNAVAQGAYLRERVKSGTATTTKQTVDPTAKSIF